MKLKKKYVKCVRHKNKRKEAQKAKKIKRQKERPTKNPAKDNCKPQ